MLKPATSVVSIAAALVLAGTSAAWAQEPIAEFYRGKTVRITVGSPAGGGHDGYARMIARHLGKYIPGNPAVVVQNIPGAGSNKAASYIATQAPNDGTAIGAVQAGAVLHPLLSDRPLPHDPSKFILLGSASSGVYFCVVRPDSPIKSFAELFTKELVIGTSGEGATVREMPILLINVLGVKLRLVGGYAGSNEILLAIDRNEVQGACGMGWSAVALQRGDWLKSGTLRALAQEDLLGHPDLNKIGIPLTPSFAKTEVDRQVLEMMYSQNLFSRPYILPGGVPPERVAVLRKAFMAAMTDPALVAEANKSGMELGSKSGEEVQALVTRLYALPREVIEQAKRATVYKPPAR